MAEFWEQAFLEKERMWGDAPTTSAILAKDDFVRARIETVLIPGVGYGRNARPFIDAGMKVTGIEISDKAITLARTELGLDLPIHHGSVTDMPFDAHRYGGIFCFGLLYLFDAAGRAKLLRDCAHQLEEGGRMIFSVVSKTAPMYGLGAKLGEDFYERLPGLPMFFYDEASVRRELGPFGLVEVTPIEESPAPGHPSLPFLYAVCEKRSA